MQILMKTIMKPTILLAILLALFACRKETPTPETASNNMFDFSGAKSLVQVDDNGEWLYKKMIATGEIKEITSYDNAIKDVRISPEGCLLLKVGIFKDVWYVDKNGNEALIPNASFEHSQFDKNGDLYYYNYLDKGLYLKPLGQLTSVKGADNVLYSSPCYLWESVIFYNLNDGENDDYYAILNNRIHHLGDFNLEYLSAIGDKGVFYTGSKESHIAYFDGDSLKKAKFKNGFQDGEAYSHSKGSFILDYNNPYNLLYYIDENLDTTRLAELSNTLDNDNFLPLIYEDNIVYRDQSRLNLYSIDGRVANLASGLTNYTIGLIGSVLYYQGKTSADSLKGGTVDLLTNEKTEVNIFNDVISMKEYDCLY